MPTRPARAPPGRAGLRGALAAALLALPAGRAAALAEEVFGNPTALQLQPELALYHQLGEDFRVLLKLEPTFIPSEGYAESGVSAYAAWMVAPYVRSLIDPDVAKARRLEVRLGAGYLATVEPGTVGSSKELRLEVEVTARYELPLEILASNRNRAEARWQVDGSESFTMRLRTRLQLERGFELSSHSKASLTPFASLEFLWSTAQDMWAQFRLEAGLQLAAFWFWKGQNLELKATALTYLQPSRSYAPVIGFAWCQYI
jgi:hypothetical protein